MSNQGRLAHYLQLWSLQQDGVAIHTHAACLLPVLHGGQPAMLKLGERGFDFANLLCNPDAALATAPGRLYRQVALIAAAAQLDAARLLAWVVAWAGLSSGRWHAAADGAGRGRHRAGSLACLTVPRAGCPAGAGCGVSRG